MSKTKVASTAGAFRAAYTVYTTGDLIWPTQSARDLIDDYVDGLIDGHLLLHGPFGTGKTEIAKMVPFALTGEDQIHADIQKKVVQRSSFVTCPAIENSGGPETCAGYTGSVLAVK